MRKWLAVLLFLGIFAFPFSARAQNEIKLTGVQVQLWPEYDQPSMLVIYDFKLPDGIKLPVNISIRFPAEASLVAVASQSADGSLLNTDYVGPTKTADQNWQTVTVNIQTQATYHIEYYQPLSKSGQQRQFSYIWPGDFPVDDLSISVRVPVDTTNMITDPIMKATQSADGTSYLIKDFGAQGTGQEFSLQVSYTKTTDNLTVSQQNIQPSQPLGANTPGRVMLTNYLPYILGGLGILLIAGGLLYFWQSSRGRQLRGRKRHAAAQTEEEVGSDIYCHQCGTRARVHDRFCRVCGTKLRVEG